MLKRWLPALVIILVTAACTQAPPPQDIAGDKAKLEADATVWFAHYAKADAEALASLYAEDAILMPPGAPRVTGRAGIKAFFAEDSSKSKAGGITIKNGAVTGVGVNGDEGWISGVYTVVDAKGTTLDSGSYLSVHHRTNGQWLYTRDIWNSDQPPAPAAPAAPPKAGGKK